MKIEDWENETSEYREFVEKFKPKKTTDDCYTPPEVYEAVKEWAVEEYGLYGRQIVRPFFPGGDYENAEYPAGCVVLDNPPFSIISKICAWYDAHKVDYFLFAPHLTLFTTNSGKSNYIVTKLGIVYENGARVSTGFVTNLGGGKDTMQTRLARQGLKGEREKGGKEKAGGIQTLSAGGYQRGDVE